MWTIKEFDTREDMNRFIEKYKHRLQFTEVFINNGFCVEYKPLRRITI